MELLARILDGSLLRLTETFFSLLKQQFHKKEESYFFTILTCKSEVKLCVAKLTEQSNSVYRINLQSHHIQNLVKSNVLTDQS
jgi:hypothetical protein